jgi:hypothetical protein
MWVMADPTSNMTNQSDKVGHVEDPVESKRPGHATKKWLKIEWNVSLTKWATIRDTYLSSTGTISTQLRTYALAGFAIVWLFKTGDGSVVSPYVVPEKLLVGALFLIGLLLLDLLQYLYKSIIWDVPRNNATKEKASPKDDDEFYVWDKINSPATVIFYSKIVALIIGYVWIFRHVWAVLYP